MTDSLAASYALSVLSPTLQMYQITIFSRASTAPAPTTRFEKFARFLHFVEPTLPDTAR